MGRNLSGPELLEIIFRTRAEGWTTLDLSDCQLTELPPEIGSLLKLTTLYLYGNRLSTLPPEIGQLVNLTTLDLYDNRLSLLPPEIGQLVNLTKLDLYDNKLTVLPTEIGRLEHLATLDLGGNHLTSPPPEIVKQGSQAVMAYLRGILKESDWQWISKLILVGEGGVGKTALLRSLRGEPFNDHSSTTHGIAVASLNLLHPTKEGVTMDLKTWDFGGQEIYHATHQFFLTNRSLFLVVWNARHGYDQGKLPYWLNTIKTRAPDSPVLLIATHIDERDADIPLSDLKRKFPQIVGHYPISNVTREGVEALRNAISVTSAGLPLMGEMWPSTWLEAAKSIRASTEKQIPAQVLWETMARHGVTEKVAQQGLAQWMHELGDILYFQEDEERDSPVILKPQWVTEYISKVLENQDVIDGVGIFTTAQMKHVWGDISPAMQNHFLHLMERFDLSYRTLEDHEISLVVERLPLDMPSYKRQWDDFKKTKSCREISMRFVLNTIPAGIPTWFIARSHRFTTHTHWRLGALLADRAESGHLALVRAFPDDRYLQLSVCGPYPYDFFALLKDGLELTLARFPGLEIKRLIPCPCAESNKTPCEHEFDEQHLRDRIAKKPSIECPISLEYVSVPKMLFGVDWNTRDAVLKQLSEVIDSKKDSSVESMELRTLAQRKFTHAFHRDQALIESHCPNIFSLRPMEQSVWQKIWTGEKMQLQLYCQAPGFWHPTSDDGHYTIEQSSKWLQAISPYIQNMAKTLKYVVPFVGPWVHAGHPVYEALIKNDIQLMEQLVRILPEIEATSTCSVNAKGQTVATHSIEHVEGAALREMRKLLDELDPKHRWGGLKKVLTPEGHLLWLCKHHAKEYTR
jgi:small GTP-binding protein